MTAAILCLMALADASFSGFRAFAGRDGRIDKRAAKVESIRRGAVVGLIALVVLAAVLLAMIAAGATSYSELEAAGNRLWKVYALYAAVITLGFAAYFSPWLELRSLGTVVVLGPGTFIRPFVIAGGAWWAVRNSSAAVGVCALVAVVVMLSIELVLNRHYAARMADHPFSAAA